MKDFLVTGFTPFLEHKTNPTQEIVQNINDQNIDTIVFDVSYKEVEESLNNLELEKYKKIILLGLSSSRDYISIEEVGYNEINVEQPDNDGNIIQNEVIEKNGPRIVRSELDTEKICQNFLAQNSTEPGRYLCNFLYYLVLRRNKKSVFIHVPKDINILEFSKKIKQLFS